MPGKINVFGWKGVNVVKNPLQLEDNELTKAQNAQPAPDADGSLEMRGGMSKVNSVAGAGTIKGYIGVPLAASNTRTFYVGIDQDATTSYQWVTSTDAFATTATSTSPGAVESGPQISNLTPQLFGRVISTRGRLIYPGKRTATTVRTPYIRVWDGVFDREVARVPENPLEASDGHYVYDMIIDGGRGFFITHDGDSTSNLRSRVFQLDLTTYSVIQVGESFGPDTGSLGSGGVLCLSLCMHGGQLFLGTGEVAYNQGATGKVYRIRPEIETTWTLDGTFAAKESPYSMASYKGRLFAGVNIFSGVGRLMVRSTAGAWTSSTDTGGAPSGGDSGWTGLTVFGDNLYACRFHSDSVTSETTIHKYDNSSWTSVKTIDTGTVNPKRGVTGLVHNSKLYMLCVSSASAQVSHTSNGTAWTDITTNLTTGVLSRFGVLVT